MDPDKAHTEYFKTYDNKEHTRMSQETFRELTDLERRLEAKVDLMLEKLNTKLNSKMDKTTFWTVFGIQLSILIGMIGWLATGVERLNESIQNTREQVVETRVEMVNTKEAVSDLRTQLKDFELIK